MLTAPLLSFSIAADDPRVPQLVALLGGAPAAAPAPAEGGEYMTVREVVELTGYCEKTIRNAVKRGDLRPQGNGLRAQRFRRSDVVAWMAGEGSNVVTLKSRKGGG